MKKHVLCMTQIAFSSVKVITGGQLPGVRGLRGHLLYTVTFFVSPYNRRGKRIVSLIVQVFQWKTLVIKMMNVGWPAGSWAGVNYWFTEHNSTTV